MRFVVSSSDYSGLGFAIRLKAEGHDVVLATAPSSADAADPERMRRYDLVGAGMVDKEPLPTLLQRRDTLRDCYWVWDHNHSPDENEMLRSEGQKVLGGGRYAWQMEHDRHACLDAGSAPTANRLIR